MFGTRPWLSVGRATKRVRQRDCPRPQVAARLL